ncbi:MAG: hypothetical protein WBW16_15145 [Bacteroidota bacterium]
MTVNCPYGNGEFKEDLQLLVCKPTGRVTNDLMNDTVTCQGCHHQIDALRFNRFHDFRDVTGVDLHFGDMVNLAAREREKRKGLPPVKACFLVSNPVVFGTLRIYQTLAEDAGVEVHVSYNISQLARVLGVDESVLTI